MKKIRKKILFLLIISCSIGLSGVAQQQDIIVHDPSIIKEGDTYHIFCTGLGITHWYSTDLKHWTKGKPVFQKAPKWTDKVVPGFNNVMWAPDISYYNGLYYLYYSVSAFAKNTSAIGVATNKTLNEKDPDYHWEDHGIVVESVPGRDMWNAIDPNLAVDNEGTPWMSFGSFWEGIKLVKLDKDRIHVTKPQKWYTIATRKRTFGLSDTLPGDAAIEAPFIYQHGDYYYLFVSYDYCCRGVSSSYKVKVGRSKKITGPYLDIAGMPMIQGGASTILKGNSHWPGQGHNAILEDNGKTYLVVHAYDATDHGIPKLRILPIRWENGWPMLITP